MTVPDEHDCHRTDEPKCPYCGHDQGDFWEVSGNAEGDGEHECGNCGRLFRWSCYVSIDYNTEPIIGPHKLSEYTIKSEALDE